jgi:lysophospholipase L1-like esterase
MRRFLAITMLFFYCLGCACGQTGKAELPVPKVSSDDAALVPAIRSPKWWVERHISRINKNVIANQKIVFIGDSITHGFELIAAWKTLNNLYKNKITNLGFSGDSTEHVIWRLENGEFPSGINPEYVVLMIGTNNKNKPESIAAGIGKIIKIINANSPKSKILLFPILPRGKGLDDPDTKRNYAVNRIIKNYSGYLNVRYIDIGPFFVNESGELLTELFAKDRLHIKSEGYEIWKDKIIEAVGR